MEFLTPPPARTKRGVPVWWAPPRGVLPVATTAEVTLVRTDEIAMFVRDIAAYPNGFEFTVCAFKRHEEPKVERLKNGPFGLGFDSDPPPELIRYGVQFSDGRKATTLGYPASWDTDPAAALNSTGSGHYSSSPRWDERVWVWPLPPPGPLVFACEWPKHDIGTSTGQIDASVVIEAAEKASPIWPG